MARVDDGTLVLECGTAIPIRNIRNLVYERGSANTVLVLEFRGKGGERVLADIFDLPRRAPIPAIPPPPVSTGPARRRARRQPGSSAPLPTGGDLL